MAEKKETSGVTEFDEHVRSVVGDIFKTTDGYFNSKPWITKTRRVIVIRQRKDDGAVILVKICKRKGKEKKIGKDYIPALVLSPAKHPSLKVDSIVEREVHFGVKRFNEEGKAFRQIILPDDLTPTGDRLTEEEFRQVKKEVRNADEKHRAAYEKTVKEWEQHFPKPKE